MRAVGSVIGRAGRVFGLLATSAVLTVGLAACTKAVSGTALSGGSAVAGTATPSTRTPTTPGPTPQTTGSSTTGVGDLNAKAKDACDSLPKNAAMSAFGLPDVKVDSGGGSTQDGVIQFSCAVSSSHGFKSDVLVQFYPANVLSSPDDYAQVMRQKFSPVQDLGKIGNADVAGALSVVKDGNKADEAFAARKDPETGGVDVLLVAVADVPGIQPKLVAFLTALAST